MHIWREWCGGGAEIDRQHNLLRLPAKCRLSPSNCTRYGRFMAHVDESCHVWIRHVTCERVTLRIPATSHLSLTNCTRYEWVMSHVHEAHVTWRIDTSCQVWMCHIIRECVLSHMDVTHGHVMSHTNNTWSCHVTHERDCVLSHMDVTRMSHVTFE